MDQLNIRNFVIIAHIDHGKSTLADRMLEETGTVEKRLMKPQYLDQLDLERERGITIKMAPVRMLWNASRNDQRVDQRQSAATEYVLNLIDTPGHSDFAYEVSRALAAVEGAVLLVDATQGIQAQTLANFENAKRARLHIIGAVNKIDAASPEQSEQAVRDIAELLGVKENRVMRVSGKTGEGVRDLLQRIVEEIPPPARQSDATGCSRALVFDSFYDEHKGIVASVRVFDKIIEHGDIARLLATQTQFKVKEIGHFTPALTPNTFLSQGETGYIATGIKDADTLKIGETIAAKFQSSSLCESLSGYQVPDAVVFVSFYPEDGGEYESLRRALGYLRLNDAALHFEPDTNEILGRGFKGGFLGRLHFEITADRLKREFRIQTVHSFPSVAYQIKLKQDGWVTITNPKDFPDDAAEALEPMTSVEILTPPRYIGPLLQLKELYRFSDIELKPTGSSTMIAAKLPLADLISDLDDKLKSVSEGFASLSYTSAGWQRADVVKTEIRVSDQIVPGLTRIIPRQFVEHEARQTVEKLKKLLPRQQFPQAVQAAARGRIIARETIPALRKDVTGYLYGGDRTRKMKLWKKQQKGKERLKERGVRARVDISATIFKELLKR